MANLNGVHILLILTDNNKMSGLMISDDISKMILKEIMINSIGNKE